MTFGPLDAVVLKIIKHVLTNQACGSPDVVLLSWKDLTGHKCADLINGRFPCVPECNHLKSESN